MIDEFIPVGFSDAPLQPLHVAVYKLNHFAGFQTHHVIMMPALVQFENRPAALEIVPGNKAGMFELRQDPIYRCEPNVFTGLYQLAINIFGGQMAFRTFFQ